MEPEGEGGRGGGGKKRRIMQRNKARVRVCGAYVRGQLALNEGEAN